MDETRGAPEVPDPSNPLTLLEVPEEYAAKVLEYLAKLQQKDAEVAGHAMGILTIKGLVGTGPTMTGPKDKPRDVFYLDVEQ